MVGGQTVVSMRCAIDSVEEPFHGNCGGKGTGMVGGQTVGSMGCAANQRNVVCQSNYALKAMNGAGNDIIACDGS